MLRFETIEDAKRIARKVLDGEIDPNLGCGLIRSIAQGTNFPDELSMFVLLGHEQYDHEQLGITSESCIPDILQACEELLGRPA